DVEPEFADWMHFVMQKVGLKTERSEQHVKDSIAMRKNAPRDLNAFGEQELKRTGDIQVPDFLMEAKPTQIGEMTVGQWRATRDAIIGLYNQGRNDMAVWKGARKENFENIRELMVDEMKNLRTIFKRERKEGPRRGLKGVITGALATYRAASLTVE